MNARHFSLAALIFVVGAAQAADLHVMSSQGTKEAYLHLVPQFERASGHKVTTTWAGTVDLLQRIKAGESVDMVIAPGAAVDELSKLGKLVPGSRVDIAKSGVGVAVRAGLPKPDLSSGEAVKRALLGAKSIAYSSGPSGVYLADLFQRWGVMQELKPKIIQTKPGVPVGEVLARGDAEIGFQQVSELLSHPGITYVGPLPADIQLYTVFAAGTHASAKDRSAVDALTKFLTSRNAEPVFKKAGMEPAATY
jgi:molybdate transport system substrate-binding protein